MDLGRRKGEDTLSQVTVQRRWGGPERLWGGRGTWQQPQRGDSGAGSEALSRAGARPRAAGAQKGGGGNPPPPRSGKPAAGSYLRGSAPAGLRPPPCPGRGSWLARLAAPAAETRPAPGWDRPPATPSRARPVPAPAPLTRSRLTVSLYSLLSSASFSLSCKTQRTGLAPPRRTGPRAAPSLTPSRPRTFSFSAPLRASPPPAGPSMAAGPAAATASRGKQAVRAHGNRAAIGRARGGSAWLAVGGSDVQEVGSGCAEAAPPPPWS